MQGRIKRELNEKPKETPKGTTKANFRKRLKMKPNNKCPSCNSTETEIVYEVEAIFSVCKVCRVKRSKSWF